MRATTGGSPLLRWAAAASTEWRRGRTRRALVGRVTPGREPPPMADSAPSGAARTPPAERRVAQDCGSGPQGVQGGPDHPPHRHLPLRLLLLVVAQGGRQAGQGDLVRAQGAGEGVPLEAGDEIRPARR